MEFLLIDGYNVINAWRDVFDVGAEPLEDMRDKLLTMLSNYQGFKKLNIIVVFDAHMVKGSKQKEEDFDNIKVIFTKENETADNYIERFVYRMSSSNKVSVVTSDYLEQRMVLTGGGVRMTPRELRDEINKTSSSYVPKETVRKTHRNTVMDRMDPELLQKLEKMRRDKM